MTYIPPTEEQKLLDSSGSVINPATEDTLLTLNSLIETLQETNRNLSSLGSAMSSGAAALRVAPISSVSIAVTGPATSAQVVAALLTQTNTLWINNTMAIQSNINNVIIT